MQGTGEGASILSRMRCRPRPLWGGLDVLAAFEEADVIEASQRRLAERQEMSTARQRLTHPESVIANLMPRIAVTGLRTGDAHQSEVFYS